MDIETISRLVSYDPESGHLRWKWRGDEFFSVTEKSLNRIKNSWNSANAGRIITSTDTYGYVSVHIFIHGVRHRLSGHRVAWALTHGVWPEIIDHINGDMKDNRLCNLRSCTASDNNRNQRLSARNTSGKIGVTFHKGSGKWRAWFRANGVTTSLGYYAKIDDAIAARIAAENKAGFFEAERLQSKWAEYGATDTE